MYLIFSYWKKRRAGLVRARFQIDPNEITFDAQTDEVRKLSSIYILVINQLLLESTVTIGTMTPHGPLQHCTDHTYIGWREISGDTFSIVCGFILLQHIFHNIILY